MLEQEAEAFSRNEDDIGYIQNLRAAIELTDETPVRKNYTALPRSLYPGVKSYAEDLLNKNCI